MSSIAEAITVFKPGSSVIVGEDIPAIVLQVSFTDIFAITYKVAWWINRERKEVWVDSREVRSRNDGKSKLARVGFVTE